METKLYVERMSSKALFQNDTDIFLKQIYSKSQEASDNY